MAKQLEGFWIFKLTKEGKFLNPYIKALNFSIFVRFQKNGKYIIDGQINSKEALRKTVFV
jgi:hypothetical protein